MHESKTVLIQSPPTFANVIENDGHMDTEHKPGFACGRNQENEGQPKDSLVVVTKGDASCPGLAKGPFVGSDFAWAGWTGQGTVPYILPTNTA